MSESIQSYSREATMCSARLAAEAARDAHRARRQWLWRVGWTAAGMMAAGMILAALVRWSVP